jgi:hypothetical protein
MNCQTFSTGYQLGRSRRQRQERDVAGDDETGGDVPACLVEDENGMRIGHDGGADLGEVRLHRLGVGEGHDESRALAELRADGTEGEPCRAIGPSDNGERPTWSAGRAARGAECRGAPSGG